VSVCSALAYSNDSMHESLQERKSSAFLTLKRRAGWGASAKFLYLLFAPMH